MKYTYDEMQAMAERCLERAAAVPGGASVSRLNIEAWHMLKEMDLLDALVNFDVLVGVSPTLRGVTIEIHLMESNDDS